VVRMRVAETLEHLKPCMQTGAELRRLIQAEARSLAREIEERFVKMGFSEFLGLARPKSKTETCTSAR